MKKKGLKKLIIIAVIIVAVIIVAVVALKGRNRGTVVENEMVQLQAVEKMDLSESISLSGTVSGDKIMNYSSDANATFLTVNVEVGDEVKEGDVLATLDKEEIKKQIKSLEKTIASSQAILKNQSDMNREALEDAKAEQKEQLAEAEEAIAEAKVAASEAKAYRESLSTDDETYADAVAAEKAAEKEYKAAQKTYNDVKKSTDDAIKSAQNTIDMEKYSESGDEGSAEQLATLQKQLKECEIICKEDGIVTSVNVAADTLNTPGAIAFTVENNTSMIMTASVDETDILKLQEGMKAIVTAKALGEQEIKGEVVKVLKVANGTTGTMSEDDGMSSGISMTGFSVQIKLEKSDLISGMSAKAKIILRDKQNALCVPYDLVQYDEDGAAYVLCAEQNEDETFTAVKKTVTVGEEIDYYTEVTGGDLQEGDYVIMDISIMEGDVFEGMMSMMDGDLMEEETMY